jgi:hypothetical protein
MHKPHLIIRVPSAQYKTAGGDLGQLTYDGAQVPFRGMIAAMSQEAAYSQYQKEVKAPHECFAPVLKGRDVEDQDVLIWKSRRFRVMAPPQIQEQGQRTDHVRMLLQEITHAPA